MVNIIWFGIVTYIYIYINDTFIFAVNSQNAGFGLPSSFSWIEKYTGLPTPSPNPFMLDVFDPFKVANKPDDGKLFIHHVFYSTCILNEYLLRSWVYVSRESI